MESIFRLDIIRYYHLGRKRVYPKRTFVQGCVNFLTLAAAEVNIPRLAMKYDDICCFIIRELPMDREFMPEDSLSKRVYLSNGTYHNGRELSSIDAEEQFLGRRPDEIFFRRGDLVSVFNDVLERIELATIISTPPTKDEVATRLQLHPDLHLDYSDDAYTIIFGKHDLNKLSEVELTRGHSHYPTHLVFKPTEI